MDNLLFLTNDNGARPGIDFALDEYLERPTVLQRYIAHHHGILELHASKMALGSPEGVAQTGLRPRLTVESVALALPLSRRHSSGG